MEERQSSDLVSVAGRLRAGAARSDITADGVVSRDPLYAKVLVLEDGETMAVIVSMDVPAIGGRRTTRGMLDDVGEGFLPRCAVGPRWR